MIGQKFGNYQAISLLGEGGMGAVYLATHPEMGRQVAVKVLRRELVSDPGSLTRFLNEAKASNAIRHPNIVEILDLGAMPDGQPYIVMELLEGMTLSSRLRAVKRLSIEQAVELGCQTASALGAAHRKGIVHRDVKPDNLFIIAAPRRDDREIVKVLDFGIAKLQATFSGVTQTRTGALMGTPIYMSPEQCLGTKQVDNRTDVYALGVILYEMLCGEPPFVSDGIGELINMHINVAPRPPTALVPTLPAWLDTVILRALSKRPEDRFATMSQLEDGLRRGPSGTDAHQGRPASAVGSLATVAATTPRAGIDAMTIPGAASGTTPTGRETGTHRPAPHHDEAAADRWGDLPSERDRAALERPVFRRPWALPATAGAVVVCAGGLLLLAGIGKRRGTDSTPAALATSLPTGPAAHPAQPAVEPPRPSSVQIRIDSNPPGASVSDAASGRLLGQTPLRLERPRGGELKLRVLKTGFVEQDLALTLDADRVLPLALEKVKTRTPAFHRHLERDEPAKL